MNPNDYNRNNVLNNNYFLTLTLKSSSELQTSRIAGGLQKLGVKKGKHHGQSNRK